MKRVIEMEDEELRSFLMKVGIWAFVVVVFGGLLTIILINKFGSKEIDINKTIDKNQQLLILVVNQDTKNKKELKQVLKKSNISYTVIHRDKERYFNDFLNKLSLTEKDIVEPTVIYVENQQAMAILVEIEDEEALETFIEKNTTSEEER